MSKQATAGKAHEIDVNPAELEAIVERAKQVLSAEEHGKLAAAMATLVFLAEELKRKGTSIERLRALLFGAKTEKTRQLFGEGAASAKGQEPPSAARPKPPGHGRHAAAAYVGAQKVTVAHPTFKAGQSCPGCLKGCLYPLRVPRQMVRFHGVAPLSATCWEMERLRCNLCQEVFAAPPPAGLGEKKYDETATAMVALLKYGTGLPFNRIEKLHAGMGIPLPATTQWEIVRDGAGVLAPAHEELVRQAAQGDVLHNDDTAAKILEIAKEQRAAAMEQTASEERTGVFTSGIASTAQGHRVAVFFTGVQHAGENLADVLARRAAELPRPIQMCDGLSRNTGEDFQVILANCLAHARRKYVEVAEHFPEECRYVLELLGKVYEHDAEARKQGLSANRRLALHQEKSRPLLDELERWMKQQLDERNVEPNSGLGQAIRYMQNRWPALTLFLRQPGAPLDNNLAERVLKKAILHRKNALFFKTRKGARVADLYMSLIHTCELNRVNPFDYVVALLRHGPAVAQAPADWMPWNYPTALARLPSPSGPGPPP